ncbi:hypothetical protein Nepgr_005354 [Nepenthes gracilis]|uniref:Uncharacterized protein n=1 Tax=Nepenthes gracilis TaxID=150966 RepID=A0AAD3S392_NEPGR|nr:hypothetical protein Nepgr_005354 [Nepenthes gracilis]
MALMPVVTKIEDGVSHVRIAFCFAKARSGHTTDKFRSPFIWTEWPSVLCMVGMASVAQQLEMAILLFAHFWSEWFCSRGRSVICSFPDRNVLCHLGLAVFGVQFKC